MIPVLYIFGCFVAVAVRALMWLDTQPPGTGLKRWVTERKWANLSSLLIALLGTWAWMDGSLLAWSRLDEYAKVTVSTGASPFAGFLLTYGARAFLAKILAKLGANGDAKG